MFYWRFKKPNKASKGKAPRRQAVYYSDVSKLNEFKKTRWYFLRHSNFFLRSAAAVLLILSLARPQAGRGEVKRKSDGLDIMMVLDTSGSMRALDFVVDGRRYNRLQVVKSVFAQFVAKRTEDRIGMVVFGTHAFAQAPLTLDHSVLLSFLEQVEIGMAGESTAVGDALAVATNRMKDIKAKSKIVILLTDGSNTAGRARPKDIAAAAKAVGVKVYAIGVGSKGLVPFPNAFGGTTKQKIEIDEESLKEIASITGGQYFRAKNTEELVSIYEEIDSLEKTKIEVASFQIYEEKFTLFLLPALLLLVMELLLGLSRLPRASQ